MKTLYILIILVICFGVLKNINKAENKEYTEYEAKLLFSQMNNWKIQK